MIYKLFVLCQFLSARYQWRGWPQVINQINLINWKPLSRPFLPNGAPLDMNYVIFCHQSWTIKWTRDALLVCLWAAATCFQYKCLFLIIFLLDNVAREKESIVAAYDGKIIGNRREERNKKTSQFFRANNDNLSSETLKLRARNGNEKKLSHRIQEISFDERKIVKNVLLIYLNARLQACWISSRYRQRLCNLQFCTFFHPWKT